MKMPTIHAQVATDGSPRTSIHDGGNETTDGHPPAPVQVAAAGLPPISIPDAGGDAADGRPSNLLAALRCDAVVHGLGTEALRCVNTDLATFARLSDPSKGRRHKWKREEIEQRLAALPCDPVLLRPIVERVMPARLRIRPAKTATIAKRWSTIKSSIRRVLKLTGWIDDDPSYNVISTSEWARLAGMLKEPKSKSVFLRFASFCERSNLGPADAGEDILNQYRQWLVAHTLKLLVNQKSNHVRSIWNQQERVNPDWPRIILKPPAHPLRHPDEDRITPAYIAAVDNYLDKLRHPNPLDPLFSKRRAEATLAQRRGVLLQSACILVAGGRDPESITSLRDVTTPEAVKKVLLHLYERLGKGQEWTSRAVCTACCLRDAALYVHVTEPSSLTATDIATIAGFRKLVRKRDAHLLTKKTRERLAVLEDPDTEERFLRVSDEAFEEADVLLADGQRSRAAHLYQAALGLAMLIHKPLRRGMLSLLDTKRHFQRDRRGRAVALRIPAEEVEKSTVDIEAALTTKLSNRIFRHEQVYIPIITNGAPSTALFVNPDGNTLDRNQLAAVIVKLIKNKLGIEFNVHLIRHWVANIVLDDDPRNGSTVQHLLGHRNPISKRRYGSARTRSAHRKYAQLLDRKVADLRRWKAKRQRKN